MNRSDENIERVLSALREVQAPAGMERRVLAAMEERAAARAGLAWRAWSLGLAAVVVVGAAVVAMTPRRVQQQGFAVAKLRAVAPVGSVELVQKRNTEILRFAPNDLAFHAAPIKEQAEDEPIATGGIPAPPMPLTEEEKLLLHLAHRSDPQELTPLIAEVRARKDAEFDAEFQEFFAPPAPPTEEKQTDPTMNDKGESR